MIEIHQLRYAAATACTMIFSRAASSFNIKQFTISKSIATLEEQLGVNLFERSTRAAIPLESGQTFLEVARRILAVIDNLKKTAMAVDDLQPTIVRQSSLTLPVNERGRLIVKSHTPLFVLRYATSDYAQAAEGRRICV